MRSTESFRRRGLGSTEARERLLLSVDLAREARDRFPTRYRAIVWSHKESEIDVMYRNGTPEHKQEYYDWDGVKVRQMRFFNMDKQYREYHFPMPATAKEVLAYMAQNGGTADEVIEKLGLSQITDRETLAPIVEVVIAHQAAQVAAYRAGKTQVLGYLVGQVMRATGGRADPQSTVITAGPVTRIVTRPQ